MSLQYHIQEAWHSFIDAKCRWRFNQLDGAGSNRELLGQRKGMKIYYGAIPYVGGWVVQKSLKTPLRNIKMATNLIYKCEHVIESVPELR